MARAGRGSFEMVTSSSVMKSYQTSTAWTKVSAVKAKM
jgi:hypothetical protein